MHKHIMVSDVSKSRPAIPQEYTFQDLPIFYNV